MNTQVLLRVLKETALQYKVDLDLGELHSIEQHPREYSAREYAEFRRDLTEAARKVNLIVMEQAVRRADLESFVDASGECIAVFTVGAEIHGELLVAGKSDVLTLLSTGPRPVDTDLPMHVFVIMPYTGIVSDFQRDVVPSTSISPLMRFIRLLATERKEIAYVLVYALFIGLLGLVLPLGLQNAIELISGGVFFSSVYVLIGLVVLGMVFIGVLQLVQISMVEHLQRRIFAKAAFEFAFRIPRIRLEALSQSYAPELVNRFFDVMTIQKGLPKVLLDLSSAAIQIFFGLLLLSLYHPFFVFFSFFLVIVLIVMFMVTGPRGLNSSINESKYKYKVVQWLEELARSIRSFKFAGNTDLPIRRTDYATSNYMKYRKKHFSVLLTQLSFFVFFKVAIAGGLLVVGTVLVVDREITLGQFVASEVVIILVLNAVEKLVLYTDVVYDLLTAVDKISHVTDLPIEKTGGFDLPHTGNEKGHHVAVHNLSYQYPGATKPTLLDIDLEIKPGERLCISGPGGGGKTTLTNVIAGLLPAYTGGVSVDRVSMRDLDITNFRDHVANNISSEDLFDGTLYENITVGKQSATVDHAMAALELAGLQQYISSLPEGLNTRIVSGGKGLSSSTIHRLILARCLAKNPKLLILNDFFWDLGKTDKLELIQCVINPEKNWTLVAVSNDPLIMASCDRVVVMDEGRVVAAGSYDELLKQGIITKYFE